MVSTELDDAPTASEDEVTAAELSSVADELEIVMALLTVVALLEVTLGMLLETEISIGVVFLPLPHAAMVVVMTASNTDLTITFLRRTYLTPEWLSLYWLLRLVTEMHKAKVF
ncbi:MAG: hypothetical protein U5M23_01830 [Marinagarivorans sp.]|nr:hypothetical protein [Marinagarivorans sp.]